MKFSCPNLEAPDCHRTLRECKYNQINISINSKSAKVLKTTFVPLNVGSCDLHLSIYLLRLPNNTSVTRYPSLQPSAPFRCAWITELA